MSSKQPENIDLNSILNSFKPQVSFDSEKIKALQKGNKTVLSQAITLCESSNTADQSRAQKLLSQLNPPSQNSWRIGISGVPGVGKSSFIEVFGNYLISQGKKVAVLAIDPASSINKGAVLGDKTRMESLVQQENAFIRPSSNATDLGGVQKNTFESIKLCEAAGYDVIIIETVGVGQSEVQIRHLVDYFLLLKVAETGDELQGIKRGIMELCDAIVIHKSDIQGALQAKQIFENAMHLMRDPSNFWPCKVFLASSHNKTGFKTIFQELLSYFEKSISQGHYLDQRREQLSQKRSQIFSQTLNDSINRNSKIEVLKNQFINGDLNQNQLEAELVKTLGIQ